MDAELNRPMPLLFSLQMLFLMIIEFELESQIPNSPFKLQELFSIMLLFNE